MKFTALRYYNLVLYYLFLYTCINETLLAFRVPPYNVFQEKRKKFEKPLIP